MSKELGFKVWLNEGGSDQWIPAQEGDQYHYGQLVQFPRHLDKDAAEKEADINQQKHPERGHAMVFPVRTPKTSDRPGTNVVQIWGPPEYTKLSKGKLKDARYLEIFSLRGFTNGTHSFGDGEGAETPASDPREVAKWELTVSEKSLGHIEKVLINKEVVVQGATRGSYHERWFTGSISVRLELEEMNELSDLEVDFFTGNIDQKTPVLGRFHFQNIQQLITEAASKMKVNLPKASNYFHPTTDIIHSAKEKPEMTSAQWWQKQIEIEKAKKPNKPSGD